MMIIMIYINDVNNIMLHLLREKVFSLLFFRNVLKEPVVYLLIVCLLVDPFVYRCNNFMFTCGTLLCSSVEHFFVHLPNIQFVRLPSALNTCPMP